jgi:hypothetical protein
MYDNVKLATITMPTEQSSDPSYLNYRHAVHTEAKIEMNLE